MYSRASGLLTAIFKKRRRHWLGMANKRPYRRRQSRRFNLRRVRVTASVGAGALASLDVTAGAVGSAVADKVRFISVKFAYALSGAQVEDDSYEFGLAHSDYTAAEIEECLESQTAIDLGDKVAQERANRLVRVIGTFGSVRSAAGGSMFNDGRPVKTKLNWLMAAGDNLQLWIRNGSAVIYTTGSTITITGDLWVKD